MLRPLYCAMSVHTKEPWVVDISRALHYMASVIIILGLRDVKHQNTCKDKKCASYVKLKVECFHTLESTSHSCMMPRALGSLWCADTAIKKEIQTQCCVST